MKQRCYNPKCRGYENYGGRGIFVCDEWLNSFEAYYADMGPAPAGLSLDRIDNDGPYSLANCRWATYSQQTLNSRHRKIPFRKSALFFKAIRVLLDNGFSTRKIAAMTGICKSQIHKLSKIV